MKHIQYHLWFMVWLAFVCPTHAQNLNDAATPLTISEAVEQSLLNHYSPQIQKAAIEQARGQRTSAGRLPNPMLSYYQEDLRFAGQETGEWILSGQLPLNFLWERWPAVSTAAAFVEAEEARLRDVESTLIFTVRKTFIEYAHAQRIYAGWQRGIRILEEVNQTSRARLNEGDISGYEYQRIVLEILRYEKTAAEAEIHWAVKRSELAYLLNPDAPDRDIEIVYPDRAILPAITLEDISAAALENRPDLKADLALLRSRQAALSEAKWQRLPEISLGAGYKEQRDHFSGAVVQLNVGIPLFDRNQGQIQGAKAVAQGQQLQYEASKKQALLEVRNAFERMQIYGKQYRQHELAGAAAPDQLLRMARISYQEGETTLIQLLDAVRTYVETLQIQEDLLMQYLLSIYDLERVSGMSLLEK